MTFLSCRCTYAQYVKYVLVRPRQVTSLVPVLALAQAEIYTVNTVEQYSNWNDRSSITSRLDPQPS